MSVIKKSTVREGKSEQEELLSQLKEIANELKTVLDSASKPSQLDSHPWVRSLTVQQYVQAHPELRAKSPGYQLMAGLAALFRESMPSTPPRRGKRLDTVWGQFSILAALYFAPFEFGTTRPVTLRDAWGRIDQVISLFVFGKPESEVPEEELKPYQLTRDEPDVAPISTISDWHVKGMERFAQMFLEREQLLAAQLDARSVLLDPGQAGRAQSDEESLRRASSQQGVWSYRFGLLGEFYTRYARTIWVSLALVVLLFLGWKGVRILQLTRAVRQDVELLRQVVSADLSFDDLEETGSLLATAREDILALRRQVTPFRWAGKLFGWLPVYGGDLAYSGELLDLAAGIVIAGDEAYQAGLPLLEAKRDENTHITPQMVLEVLVAGRSRFLAAEEAVDAALEARTKIDAGRLSPKTRPLLDKLDPYLPWIRDGVKAAIVAPKLLGAEEYGPQTYLVLIQNEDELRATGGFITAVGTVTIEKGDVIGFQVEDSYAVDDYSKLYPAPPWQLSRFMDAPIWVFRDSNWSPDFPTAATWAEYLYAYGRAHSVDGVIAIDQEALRIVLQAMGPLKLDGFAEPVTASNIKEFMYAARGQGGENWFETRKDFMGPLAQALLEKVQKGSDVSLQALGEAVVKALDERHILVQVDDADASILLAHRGWDGALRPGDGDFLMVVDSNVGFNKVNAVAQTAIRYEVDLTDLANPKALLVLNHANPAKGEAPCVHGTDEYETSDYQQLINRCYWDYVRVYTLEGTDLLDATPHDIPGEWLIQGEALPGKVDRLDNNGVLKENPEGLQAFGTMIVIPPGDERKTSFAFSLPPGVVRQGDSNGEWKYLLHIQKQPGTIAVPVSVFVRLPDGAVFLTSTPEGSLVGNLWSIETRLRTDVDISIAFQVR